MIQVDLKTIANPDVWYSSVLGKFVRNGRYIVEVGSSSAHCCFEYTVVDTEANNRPICETFCLIDANKVAEALNNLEEQYE